MINSNCQVVNRFNSTSRVQMYSSATASAARYQIAPRAAENRRRRTKNFVLYNTATGQIQWQGFPRGTAK